jgi:hypothetical protein
MYNRPSAATYPLHGTVTIWFASLDVSLLNKELIYNLQIFGQI